MRCDYFEKHRCRSCELLTEPAAARRDIKLAALKELVALSNVQILPLVEPTNAFGSRGKAKLAVGGTVDAPLIGIVRPDFTVQDLTECPLHFEAIKEILRALPAIIQEFRLTPYDISARRGELKYLIVRGDERGENLLLRFVLRSTEAIARIKKAVPKLQASFPALKVISVNIQPEPAAIIEGEEEIILTAAQYHTERVGDVELNFAPQSFSQVTPEVAGALYRFIAEKVKEQKADTVLDLFCGVGGILRHLEPHILRGVGVEVSEPSILAAQKSWERGQRPRSGRQPLDTQKRPEGESSATPLEFIAADVLSYLKNITTPFDALIVNPPRRGLGKEITDEILRLNFPFIAYSSCNAETLCSDLEELSAKYQLLELAPFDMFPLTKHLEVVGTLRLK